MSYPEYYCYPSAEDCRLREVVWSKTDLTESDVCERGRCGRCDWARGMAAAAARWDKMVRAERSAREASRDFATAVETILGGPLP